MKTVLYYVSGHGFGHATRAALVAKSLADDFGRRVIVRTSAPSWLFKKGSRGEVVVDPADVDSGPAQVDCLTTDVDGTLQRFTAMMRAFPAAADAEYAYASKHKPAAVVSDISPLGVETGRRLGVPTIVVTNFLWDWILGAYAPVIPEFYDISKWLTKVYTSATRILRIKTFSGGMDGYANVKDINLIANKSGLTREEARRKLGLSPEGKYALVSLGGIGAGDFFGTVEERVTVCGLLTLGEGNPRFGRMRRFERGEAEHACLLAAADMVIGKLGYGLCSELAATPRGILYTPRNDFVEYEALDRDIRDYAAVRAVPRSRFFGENLDDDVTFLMNAANPAASASIDGARQAAGIIDGYI
ncbi:MAG: hypothetical protein HZB29_09015 [Nitrospinae bacterium]|nr:hypothetical protein [Nitrospinota bacterium]